MGKYSVLIDVDAETFLKKLPEKSNRIVKEALLSLVDDQSLVRAIKSCLAKVSTEYTLADLIPRPIRSPWKKKES